MTPDERQQLLRLGEMARLQAEAITAQGQAISELLARSHAQSLACGVLYGELAKVTADPRRKLDEMMAAFEGEGQASIANAPHIGPIVTSVLNEMVERAERYLSR